MTRDELLAVIREQCKEHEGKASLSCHRAHVLAEDLSEPLTRIGDICQEEQIKIIDCQLGCFGKNKHA